MAKMSPQQLTTVLAVEKVTGLLVHRKAKVTTVLDIVCERREPPVHGTPAASDK